MLLSPAFLGMFSHYGVVLHTKPEVPGQSSGSQRHTGPLGDHALGEGAAGPAVWSRELKEETRVQSPAPGYAPLCVCVFQGQESKGGARRG